MKKSLIAGITVLVAAAATPYYIGGMAEKRFVEAHERLQKELLYPQVSVQPGEFQRGWLSSETSTIVTFTPGKKDATPLVFTLVHHVSQLPSPGEGALMSIDSELQLPDALAQKVKPYFKEKPVLSAHSIVKLDGSEVTTLTSPAYNGPLQGEEGAKLVWQGLHVTSTTDADIRHLSVDGEIPGFMLSKHDGTFQMEKLSYHTTMQRGSHDIWLGQDRATLDSLQFQSISTRSGPANIVFNKLEFTGGQEAHDALLDMAARFSFDSAELNGLKLEKGIYDVAYNNLNIDGLEKMGKRLRAMWKQPQQDPEKVRNAIMADIPTVLSPTAEIHLRQLEVGTPMGRVSGKVKVALTEQLTEAVMQQPKKLMDMMNIDIETSVPKPMVMAVITSQARETALHIAQQQDKTLDAGELMQQTNAIASQQISGLLQQKLMVEQDNHYATVIHYTPNKLVINDQDATPMLNGMMQ